MKKLFVLTALTLLTFANSAHAAANPKKLVCNFDYSYTLATGKGKLTRQTLEADMKPDDDGSELTAQVELVTEDGVYKITGYGTQTLAPKFTNPHPFVTIGITDQATGDGPTFGPFYTGGATNRHTEGSLVRGLHTPNISDVVVSCDLK